MEASEKDSRWTCQFSGIRSGGKLLSTVLWWPLSHHDLMPRTDEAQGFAEAFMDGSIQTGDLTGLLEVTLPESYNYLSSKRNSYSS